jgi:hypothetical protein
MMNIDFGPERWNRVRETCRRWWAGELRRPIIAAEVLGRDPGRPQPRAPLLCQGNCWDFSLPAAALVDRLDWELSRRRYLGDAYPYVNMDCFGPGVMAAFLGSGVDTSTGGMWFHPPREMDIRDLHFEYDPDNVWWRRVREICAAMTRRWQGQVLVGMTDLGGNLDILASFRTTGQLLMDLCDHPDEVKRLTWEAHGLWHRYFNELHEILESPRTGYTAWCGICSDTPYYMLQCDFGYMIGPAMFDEFAKPELEATARRLGRAFYHLDGRGQLAHLPSLLAIEGLHGVQWVPGAGAPGYTEWPDVYRRIAASGRKTQLWGVEGWQAIETILRQTGAADGGWIHNRVVTLQPREESVARRCLERYGLA